MKPKPVINLDCLVETIPWGAPYSSYRVCELSHEFQDEILRILGQKYADNPAFRGIPLALLPAIEGFRGDMLGADNALEPDLQSTRRSLTACHRAFVALEHHLNQLGGLGNMCLDDGMRIAEGFTRWEKSLDQLREDTPRFARGFEHAIDALPVNQKGATRKDRFHFYFSEELAHELIRVCERCLPDLHIGKSPNSIFYRLVLAVHREAIRETPWPETTDLRRPVKAAIERRKTGAAKDWSLWI